MYECGKFCLLEDFIPRRLITESLDHNSYRRSKLIHKKFLSEYELAGLLKCDICNYITADPIEKVRELINGNTDRIHKKLRCPCCNKIYSKRGHRH